MNRTLVAALAVALSLVSSIDGIAAADAPPTPPPTPAVPSAPAAPATASSPRFRVRPYGILWATASATQPVASYGYPTAVAPTSAANPAVVEGVEPALLTFQVQQTRAGMVVGEGSPVRGQLEVDFVHFDQSSPTVQAFPRLRIAQVAWAPTPHDRLFLGQSWDLFGNTGSPLLSHSVNLVGTLFQAGNVGFMRQQLGYERAAGSWDVATAVGLQGANVGPVYNAIEQGHTPTASVRLMRHVGEHGVVGVAGVATSLRFGSGGTVDRRAAFGGVTFADLTYGSVNLHLEAYGARNLANLGALDLAMGRAGTDVDDVGGFGSMKYAHGHHVVTAMVGGAAVLHPSDVAPAYAPASAGPPPTNATASPSTGPGMVWNATAHVAYGYAPVQGLTLTFEPYLYATRWALAATDRGRLDPTVTALGATLGTTFAF